jgi:X-X-X-Leu-X-X-Gly heptad repeat protein
MRIRTVTVVVSVVALGAGIPASATAFPQQGSCADEGAFVSGNARQFGAGFGELVSGTAQAANGLADVISASHAANCEPRP